MPVPKSKRMANDKWDKENMITLGCKVKKEEASAFKDYASRIGKTANTVLKEYVQSCIEEHDKTIKKDASLQCVPTSKPIQEELEDTIQSDNDRW